MHVLSRAQTVMHIEAIGVRVVKFFQVLDEPGTPRIAALPLQDWHDLGDPVVVTVTVVPGDTLN
jgi:hypothetical protein